MKAAIVTVHVCEAELGYRLSESDHISQLLYYNIDSSNTRKS